jgi:hypothetical protein
MRINYEIMWDGERCRVKEGHVKKDIVGCEYDVYIHYLADSLFQRRNW